MLEGKETPKGVESVPKTLSAAFTRFLSELPVYNRYSTYRLCAVVGSVGRLAAWYTRTMIDFFRPVHSSAVWYKSPV